LNGIKELDVIYIVPVSEEINGMFELQEHILAKELGIKDNGECEFEYCTDKSIAMHKSNPQMLTVPLNNKIPPLFIELPSFPPLSIVLLPSCTIHSPPRTSILISRRKRL
jgi:hypothetical protein